VALLRQKITEIDAAIAEEGVEEDDVTRLPDSTCKATATGPTDRVVVRFPDGREDIVVTIGTSQHAQVRGMIEKISHIVDSAYSSVGKRKRVDHYDALQRLEMGDAGPRANRVLHLAFKGEALVGCASSTFSPGWTPDGCGHWGLLAVDPAHQGSGAATALVLAAERRLATVSEFIQIEYSHSEGDPFSQRLQTWYEDRLGFDGGPRGHSGFRRCFKRIPEDEQRRGQRRRLVEVRDWFARQLVEAEEGAAAAASSLPRHAAGAAPGAVAAAS